MQSLTKKKKISVIKFSPMRTGGENFSPGKISMYMVVVILDNLTRVRLVIQKDNYLPCLYPPFHYHLHIISIQLWLATGVPARIVSAKRRV